MADRRYDAEQYGVVQRTWFGLPKVHGGASTPYTVGSATAVTHLVNAKAFAGAVEIVKVGAYVTTAVATANNATGSSAREKIPFRIYKHAKGASHTTLISSWHMHIGDSGSQGRYTAASTTTVASKTIETGKYISIRSGSALSDKGTEKTADGTVLAVGSFAFFIDWKRKYDSAWQK